MSEQGAQKKGLWKLLDQWKTHGDSTEDCWKV